MKAQKQHPTRLPPWQLMPDEYLGDLPVSPDGRVEDRQAINIVRRYLIRISPEHFTGRIAPWCPELSFATRGHGISTSIIVSRRSDGRLLGGVYRGVPYVFKPFRGQGIGSEIVYFSDMHGGIGLSPGRYSESGMRSRLGAWRRHVKRTLDAEPYAVPQNIQKMFNRE